MKYTSYLVFLYFFVSNLIFAQEKVENFKNLTGNLGYDSQLLVNSSSKNDVLKVNLLSEANKKSPLIAGALSAALPGAGQFYNEDYIKAGIFVALEATAIALAVMYNNKANEQTTMFQNFADAHWSVAKYAQWIKDNKTALGITSDIVITINPDVNLKPWERVNWDELNKVESSRFSHKLEKYGLQQYYELIGKYPQYNHGWDDQMDDATAEYIANISERFHNYSGYRGQANTYYNNSTGAIIGLIVNHALSVVDALLSANSFNRNLSIGMRIETVPFSYGSILLIPKLNIGYTFSSF